MRLAKLLAFAALTLLLTASIAIVGCDGETGGTDSGDSDSSLEATAGESGGRAAEGLEHATGVSEYVMGTDIFEIADLALPEKGETVFEPVFGTPIERLTDASVDGYLGPGIQNEYSRTDPENLDGTHVVLRGNNADWYLCDLTDGDRLTSLAGVFNECDQEPDPRWDDEDPHRLYYVCGSELRAVDIETFEVDLVHDFSGDADDVYVIGTRTEGEPSVDRRYWAFMVFSEDWEAHSILTYDMEEDAVLGVLTDIPEGPDWVGMDASGTHALVGWDTTTALEVFSRDLDTSIKLPQGSNAHGDRALGADGRDLWVYQNIATDQIAMADLETGRETPLVPIPFSTNTDIGLHVSGGCVDVPGWVLVSTYGARVTRDSEARTWMDNQLWMLELAPSPRIWRLAHTRCYTAEHPDDEPGYFFEAFATVNRTGDHVFVGSNWGDLSEEYTDAYMLTLPDGWADEL